MRNNPLLAIVGMPGAGKSTAVLQLGLRNWPILYFGNITMEELRRQGLPSTPENEKVIRESIRRNLGNDAFAKLSLPLIQESLACTPTVVDGLYSWDEYKFLRKNLASSMYLIAICADRQIRYNRLTHRTPRPLSEDEAEKRDIAEIENIQKGGPIAMADFIVLNNGYKGELCHAVDAIADRILEQITAEDRDHDRER